MAHHKRHLDFELNLVPFIDLLSVCICFLLLTAVWIQVGTLNAKQAVGGQAAGETAKKPTLWVSISEQGKLDLEVRDSRLPSRLSRMSLPGVQGKPNLEQLQTVIQDMRNLEPQLSEVLLRPQAATMYDSIISVMDHFRKLGLINQGVVPL